jgi:hypothetical protein
MARLKLQTKRPEQKVNRIEESDTYIPDNDPTNFDLLKDNRCKDEKFTRIDKLMVNHYYLVGTEWLCEKIFYPSEYGFKEIEKGDHLSLIKMRDNLIDNGKGLYGDRPIPKINKPTSRIELKSKPQRMALSCKEEE